MSTSMTPLEWKQLEGSRILAGMAAVAALPGAGLVTGTQAGAPFFAAALASVAMAYLLWLCTDAVYYLSVQLGDRGLLEEWRPRLLRVGAPFQIGTLAFASLTVVLTLAGFGGERTAIRGPLSAEQGYIAALCFVGVCVVLGALAQIGVSTLRRDVHVFLKKLYNQS